MQANDTLISSYNGVMLCRRPTYEPVKNSGKHLLSQQRKEKTSSQNEKGSFLCGTVPTPWGNTTTKIKSQKDKVLSRLSRNDGALTRHKQWLKDMQEKRARRLKEKEEADQTKKEKDREFMERQARRRRKIRQLERDECDEVQNHNNVDRFDQEEDGANDDDAKQENKLMVGEKRCRPAWSLTEADAINTNEYIKGEEEEDILNFVDRLDFEQYFDDMELKVLVTQLKDRIHQLEKQKKHDHVLLNTVLQSENSANHDEKYNNWNYGDASRLKEDNCNREPVNDCNDISSIAESIKSCADASMTSIHSHKSMQMLVAKSRDKMQEMRCKKGIFPINEEYPVEISMKHPITIIHTEDNGARLAETKSLNKLPFKNRNPAS